MSDKFWSMVENWLNLFIATVCVGFQSLIVWVALLLAVDYISYYDAKDAPPVGMYLIGIALLGVFYVGLEEFLNVCGFNRQRSRG